MIKNLTRSRSVFLLLTPRFWLIVHLGLEQFFRIISSGIILPATYIFRSELLPVTWHHYYQNRKTTVPTFVSHSSFLIQSCNITSLQFRLFSSKLYFYVFVLSCYYLCYLTPHYAISEICIFYRSVRRVALTETEHIKTFYGFPSFHDCQWL